MNTLRVVPMCFFEVGCVLLRAEQSPLLLKRTFERSGTDNPLCYLQCLETWREVTLQKSEVIFGCEQRGWEILKRSHAVMPSGSVESDHGSNPPEAAGNKQE